MFAGGGLLPPHFQSMGFFSRQENDNHLLLQEVEEDLLQRLSQNCLLDNTNNHCQDHHLPIISSTTRDLGQASMISDYDLGGEGDLFKAPEPIIEEPVLVLDPFTSEISMISETMEVADIESIESELLSEVFYECKKDLILLEKPIIEEPPSDLSDIKIQPLPAMEDENIQKDNMVAGGPMQKTVSSSSFARKGQKTGIPLDQRIDCPSRLNFLAFQQMDFGTAFKMRRAYSEGDIKILGADNSSIMGSNANGIPVPTVQRVLSMDKYKSEERLEKLSRYRKKRTARNFGRKIKYACRKALAECQPRIRGRFARTEEMELLKPSM